MSQANLYALEEYPRKANNCEMSSYTEHLDRLNMSSPAQRRTIAAQTFLYDVITGNNNCMLMEEGLVADK